MKPTRENDAPPTITIFPILTSGTTDFTNDGITVSGTTVNVSAGATIQITGRADNFKGGVNAFSISVTKIPVGDTATGTATGVVSKRNFVPVSLGITGPNGGGKAFSYTLVSEKEVLKIDSTATNFNQQTTTLTANIRVAQYTKRISGIHFLDFDSKDSGDHFYENNGFLLSVHDPGCGIKGNDGKDRFFATDKPLPSACSIIKTEFRQYWPSQRGSPNPWGGGSYGARQNPNNPNEIDWNNACVGEFSGKNLCYIVSFIVSVPPGVNLGEPGNDPNSSDIMANTPPSGFQWNEPPPPSQSTVSPGYHTISLNLAKQTGTAGSGLIPYRAAFGWNFQGNLVDIQNPNNFTVVLMNTYNNGVSKTLAYNQRTTPDDIKDLFWSTQPVLPVDITGALPDNPNMPSYIELIIGYNKSP